MSISEREQWIKRNVKKSHINSLVGKSFERDQFALKLEPMT